MTEPCAFCAIVKGETPASIVYRDEAVMAFMDIRPLTAGHVLVVPLKHDVSILDMGDGETTARILTVGRKIAAALKDSGVRIEGFNLFLADGEVAGQEIFHVHLHIIPRFRGDGLGWIRPNDDGLPPRSELDTVAQRIRRAGGWA